MAEEEGKAPVIIKRVKKGGAGHHGGAWKVAYADFVTAMMAFFLLLWLLNSVTEEQLQGISNYFAPTTVSESPSGAGGMLGGRTIGEGAQQSNTASPSVVMSLPPTTIGTGGMDFTDPSEGFAEDDKDGLSDEEFEEEQRRREQQQFNETAAALKQAVQSLPQLKALQDSLIVDNTPEGLRIQIVDQEGLPMFPAGSSAMYEHTRALLELVAKVIAPLPQQIAIAGHTDATGFTDPSGYGNWELSADRALAARRVLHASGIEDPRINRVAGRASAEPYLADDPDSPRNRRITITLLREELTRDPAKAPDGPPPLPSIINGE